MKRLSRRRRPALLALGVCLCALGHPAVAKDDPPEAPETAESKDVGGEGFLPEGVDNIPTVDEILAGNSGDAGYQSGDRRNCMPLRSIRHIEPLDRHRVLFIMRRGDVYLNDYQSRCDGNILPSFRAATQSRGATSQLCRGDRIDWLDTFNSFSFSVQCRLGAFQEITEEQADALKVALDNQRKTARERRRQKRRAN